MPTYKGFVDSIQVRDDGWVEFSILTAHAGNVRRVFFVPNLDGDLPTVHKRLGWLSLLRDALARTLPVEIEYRGDPERGDLLEEVTVLPRASIEGRPGTRRVDGVVIWVGIFELGPLSGASPYRDFADLAGVTLLAADGSLEQFRLDLQRPDPLTAQGMLRLLMQAHRTRRRVTLIVSDRFSTDAPRGSVARLSEGPEAARVGQPPTGFVIGCEWVPLPETTLRYCHAFIERLRQRYESFEMAHAHEASEVCVVYTTSPDQTPEGDVSDDGTFIPVTAETWVSADSPLVARLERALSKGLQVRLGLNDENRLHAVDLVSPLGSAARPVWIRVQRTAHPEEPRSLCNNVPTIRTPDQAQLDTIPHAVVWKGEAYFREGIWRFVVRTGSPFSLKIDGANPCCGLAEPHAHPTPGGSAVGRATDDDKTAALQCHVYLHGLHTVELVIRDRTCAERFLLFVYRIR